MHNTMKNCVIRYLSTKRKQSPYRRFWSVWRRCKRCLRSKIYRFVATEENKKNLVRAIIKNPLGSITYPKGDFFMKRLRKFLPEPIINNAVLQHCQLKYLGSNIADPDRHEALAMQQALRHKLQKKYPDADAETIILFAAVIMRYLMQLSPDAALYATQGIRGCSDYRASVDKLRENVIKAHAESSLPTVPLLIVMVNQMLEALEEQFFA